MSLHGERYPHEVGCEECALEGVCNHCGKPAELERCTNGRCGTCHETVCGPRVPGNGGHKSYRDGGKLEPDADRQAFMDRFTGVKAHPLARGLNSLTPGINWIGCSKGLMADQWSKARSGKLGGRLHYRALAQLTLDAIAAAVERGSAKRARK